VDFLGVAGQSFGAFLAPGVEFSLRGAANDFVGKGLSGGIIAVAPPEDFAGAPENNVVAGNVVAYGATSGKIFLCGQAGERFAARNSGVTAVVEGIGDHGCEYMTGGRVLVLGPTGVNFGAGMTGGVAYVFDESNDFDLRCNLGTIDIESVAADSPEEAEIQALLQEHFQATGSRRALDLLEGWQDLRSRFVTVRGMR
jgi:glutamate synthase (NADPH/NADH) large chain